MTGSKPFVAEDSKDDGIQVSSEISVTAPFSSDEPIVTRKELWSYYRACSPRGACQYLSDKSCTSVLQR